MKLIPASSARWIMRTLSSWSGLPHAPNIIAPRQRGLTCTPVRPSARSSIARAYPAAAFSNRHSRSSNPCALHRNLRAPTWLWWVSDAWRASPRRPMTGRQLHPPTYPPTPLEARKRRLMPLPRLLTRPVLCLTASLALLASLPAAAGAVALGIADNNWGMFYQRNFNALHTTEARIAVPWDVM